jgi:hypothetical protein
MGRFLTHAFILEKYGARLDKHALGSVLGIAAATVMNHMSAGTLGIKTYTDHGKAWADAEHVAEYLDRMATQAKERNPPGG